MSPMEQEEDEDEEVEDGEEDEKDIDIPSTSHSPRPPAPHSPGDPLCMDITPQQLARRTWTPTDLDLLRRLSYIDDKENVEPNRLRRRSVHSPAQKYQLRKNPTRRTGRFPAPARPLTTATAIHSLFGHSSQHESSTHPANASLSDFVVPSSVVEDCMDNAHEEGEEQKDPPSAAHRLHPPVRTAAQGHALRSQLRLQSVVFPGCALTVEQAVACLVIATVSSSRNRVHRSHLHRPYMLTSCTPDVRLVCTVCVLLCA